MKEGALNWLCKHFPILLFSVPRFLPRPLLTLNLFFSYLFLFPSSSSFRFRLPLRLFSPLQRLSSSSFFTSSSQSALFFPLYLTDRERPRDAQRWRQSDSWCSLMTYTRCCDRHGCSGNSSTLFRQRTSPYQEITYALWKVRKINLCCYNTINT